VLLVLWLSVSIAFASLQKAFIIALFLFPRRNFYCCDGMLCMLETEFWP